MEFAEALGASCDLPHRYLAEEEKLISGIIDCTGRVDGNVFSNDYTGQKELLICWKNRMKILIFFVEN